MSKRHPFFSSLRWAWNGIIHAVVAERHMRIHLVAAVFAMLACWWLAIPLVEAVMVLLAIGLVLSMELLNTAVERVVDMISPKPSQAAKIAKDVSAGAVLVAALVALLIGLLIFLPPLVSKLGLVSAFADW